MQAGSSSNVELITFPQFFTSFLSAQRQTWKLVKMIKRLSFRLQGKDKDGNERASRTNSFNGNNGTLAENGDTNGHTNGDTNGHTNGTNGSSQPAAVPVNFNGHANGASNGVSNGVDHSAHGRFPEPPSRSINYRGDMALLTRDRS